MEDLDFRIKIQEMLVNESYWRKFSWMNNATANEIVVKELESKIKKHPLIWKLFFMIN